MRFSLRSLLILMLLAGPSSAWGWQKYVAYQEWKAEQAAIAAQARVQQGNLLRLGSISFTSIYNPSKPTSSATPDEIDALEAAFDTDKQVTEYLRPYTSASDAPCSVQP